MIRLVGVLVGVAIGANAIAQSNPIVERKDLMKANGAAARTGTQMVRGEAPFDLAKAQEVFTGIASRMERFPTLFPERQQDRRSNPRRTPHLGRHARFSRGGHKNLAGSQRGGPDHDQRGDLPGEHAEGGGQLQRLSRNLSPQSALSGPQATGERWTSERSVERTSSRVDGFMIHGASANSGAVSGRRGCPE